LPFKQLIQFVEDKGYKYVGDIDLDALTAFRVSWKTNPAEEIGAPQEHLQVRGSAENSEGKSCPSSRTT
jgi:hypothetical protein